MWQEAEETSGSSILDLGTCSYGFWEAGNSIQTKTTYPFPPFIRAAVWIQESEEWKESWEMLSSGDDITIVHMSAQQLELPAQNISRIKSSKLQQGWLVTKKWLLTVDG